MSWVSCKPLQRLKVNCFAPVYLNCPWARPKTRPTFCLWKLFMAASNLYYLWTQRECNGDVHLHFIVDTVLSSATNLLAFSSVTYPPGVTWIQMPESSCKKTFTTGLWPATTAQRSKKGKKTNEVPSKVQKQGLVSQAELRCSMSILPLCMPLKIFVFKEWWHFVGRIEWFKQNKLHYKHKALSQCNNYQQSKQTSTQR